MLTDFLGKNSIGFFRAVVGLEAKSMTSREKTDIYFFIPVKVFLFPCVGPSAFIRENMALNFFYPLIDYSIDFYCDAANFVPVPWQPSVVRGQESQPKR